ncbi:M48 family metallopeptidase [Candidatus Izimaplasma bacterium]|nr:M48 family metallopeptidase [Candidatus Izimaplasma bacterium]
MSSISLIIIIIIVLSFLYDLIISLLNFKYRKDPVPDVVSDVYDQKEYKKFLDYSLEKYRTKIMSKAIILLITILIIVFNGFQLVEEVTLNITANTHLQTILFLTLYYAIFYIVSVVVEYYDNFSVEERYGFNKSTKKLFVKDQFNELIITIGLGAVVVYILSLIYYSVGNMFYVYAFIILTIGIILFNILFVKLIMPLFYKQSPLEDGELKEKITALSMKVGYEVKDVVIIDASKRSTKLNAYFSGIGKYKKVMLFDTLLDKLTTDEILSAVAHEIGHSKHKHMISDLISSIIKLGIYLALFSLVLKTNVFTNAFGLANNNLGFGLVIFILLFSLMSKLLSYISNTISRTHEYGADMFVEKEGLGDALITALKKVAKENLGNLNPHPVFVKANYNHPPLVTRINYIKKGQQS